MAVRNYQPEPMHRFPYTRLSEAQIGEKLQTAAGGPTSHSPFSEALAGKSLRIVTDEGPTLDYRFTDGRRLSVAENGAGALSAGYGALESRQLVLLSHMMPGTQRGYHVVIDRDSNLATVFETWFSGYLALQEAIRAANGGGQAPAGGAGNPRHREVQRQIHHGYVDSGGAAPSARHHLTNRLEGKGFYWKQDNGIETLEFFPSVLSSNFIELTRFGGELTVCGPSDYLMINDHQFIYSRVEAEHSGIMTLYLIDLLDVSQVGARLGFNEKDELEYYLFKGQGELTGQIATFEPFGDNGEEVAYGNRARPVAKGQRLVYRPLETNPVMSDEEVRRAVAESTRLFASGTGGMGGYKTPVSDHLVGKSLAIRMDNGGPAIEYRFDAIDRLRWRFAGDRNWREEVYEIYEPAEELYFMAHLLDRKHPQEVAMVALDMKNGLSTYVNGRLGTPYMANEVTPTFYFGVVEMEGLVAPRYHRHGWTEDLVGQAVTWNYQPGDPGLTSMHFYATPNTYSWIIFLENGSGGLQWSSPGWYVKLREDAYLMAWVEEACNCTLGVICYNPRTMHDAGFGYHVGPEGLSLNAIGARARYAGRFDVQKYLGPKA